jgi:hypothetical protein
MRPLPDNSVLDMEFRFTATLSSDGAGIFNHRLSLRNLARAIDGAGTYEDAANISNVFDTYKPVFHRLEAVPIPAINSFSLPPILCAADYDDDDVAGLSSSTVANAYRNRQVCDVRYPFEILTNIPRIDSGYTVGTVQNSPVTIVNGFLDFQNPPYQGVLFMYGEGFPLNLTVMRVFLTIRAKCKYQR